MAHLVSLVSSLGETVEHDKPNIGSALPCEKMLSDKGIIPNSTSTYVAICYNKNFMLTAKES